MESRSERQAREEATSRSERHVHTKQKNKAPKTPKKGGHRVRNILLSLLGFILVLGIGFGIYAFISTKSAVTKTYNDSGVTKERDVSDVLNHKKPFSILLLGTDTGELGRNYKGRTDSLMLVTVNPKTQHITIMSLPRDTVLAIPGYTDTFPQKLNAAYSLGSAKTTIETVQDWLNVPIDYYALVNMNALEKVVDQIGGVSVKSPLTFNYNPYTAHEGGDNYYLFTKGSTHYKHYVNGELVKESDKLDGAAALAFSRMRYTDPQGDYGRQQRQRLVVEAIVNKAKSNPTKLVNKSFLNLISKNAQTDLTFGDMMTIATRYVPATKHLVSDHAQGTGIMINGSSYEHVDRDEQQRVTNVLRKALGLKHAKTGNLFGAKISNSVLAQFGLSDGDDSDAESDTSTSDDSVTTPSTDYSTNEYTPATQQTSPAAQQSNSVDTSNASPSDQAALSDAAKASSTPSSPNSVINNVNNQTSSAAEKTNDGAQ